MYSWPYFFSAAFHRICGALLLFFGIQLPTVLGGGGGYLSTLLEHRSLNKDPTRRNPIGSNSTLHRQVYTGVKCRLFLFFCPIRFFFLSQCFWYTVHRVEALNSVTYTSIYMHEDNLMQLFPIHLKDVFNYGTR